MEALHPIDPVSPAYPIAPTPRVTNDPLINYFMKIALIGPAWPWRGGIAHHTNHLARTLRSLGHSVDVVTFTRQYPKMLFPGESQREVGEPGPEEREINAELMIDSINPLNWGKVGRTLRERDYDLHAFKFWIPFFGPSFGSIARKVRREGRPNIAVICENFLPHERRPGDRLLTDRLFRYCNFAITQSTKVKEDLQKVYPQIPQKMQPHPVYEGFGKRVEVGDLRTSLGLDDKQVLLFFGFIRKYKGLDLLLKSLPAIRRRLPNVHLLVVGEFYEDETEYRSIIDQEGIADIVTVVSRYVPNDEVASWFSLADAVVLPYRSATNSGIVQIAYNFATPAIVTDVGSLSEVVLDGRTGYVTRDAEPETIADAVEKLYEPGRIAAFAQAIRIEVEQGPYSWPVFARGLVDFACEQGVRDSGGS